jgi:hypothetical protein
MSELTDLVEPMPTCIHCGQRFTLSPTTPADKEQLQVAEPEQPICGDCQQAKLFDQLPASIQQQVDDLLYMPAYIAAISLLRQTLGISLQDGTSLFHWRYKMLSTLYPTRFSLVHDDDQTLF